MIGTGALNELDKLAAKMGWGYADEAIRAGVLLTGGLRAESRGKVVP